MVNKNRPLPIGSVVLLKGANTKMMIIGYLKYGPENRTDIYDYAGCLYPRAIIPRRKPMCLTMMGSSRSTPWATRTAGRLPLRIL